MEVEKDWKNIYIELVSTSELFLKQLSKDSYLCMKKHNHQEIYIPMKKKLNTCMYILIYD